MSGFSALCVSSPGSLIGGSNPQKGLYRLDLIIADVLYVTPSAKAFESRLIFRGRDCLVTSGDVQETTKCEESFSTPLFRPKKINSTNKSAI